MKQVPQCVFILIAVESPQNRPTVASERRQFGGGNRSMQNIEKVLLASRVGPCPSTRRHLARLHQVMQLDPGAQFGWIISAKRQTGQIESAPLACAVVASGAIVAQKRGSNRSRIGGTG
jgi:hypothetical protein